MATNLYSPSMLRASNFPGCDSKVQCDPIPVCPTCGGLHTLCRPRFFAGQLLTEEDLNRLDHYVVEKSRLHNRYLHGWGVVCGLEVVCSVCNQEDDRGKVVVKPGYALSPCGNDIVVSKLEAVDLCDLINRCRPPDDECLQPRDETACMDAEEDWVLAVCYKEQTAREVVALRASSDCSCTNCQQPAGQCACKGQASTPTRKQDVAKGPNVSRAPQCEPTVVCETYSFRAFKAPKLSDQKRNEMGALVKRFVCCAVPFIEELGSLPTIVTPALRLQWLLNLKESIRDFLRREGLYDCEVAQKLADVDIPAISDSDFQTKWVAATVKVLAIALLVIKKCFCAALLPPCPEPAMDDCVPIATVTLRKNPCRVVKVCNVSSRRFLLTWPNIHYWLSWIPLFGSATGASNPRTLRDVLVKMCCGDQNERFKINAQASFVALNQKTQPMKGSSVKATVGNMSNGGAPQSTDNVFVTLLSRALNEHEVGADLGTLLLASMGAPGANGQPLASDMELQNPAEFMLMNQLLVPTMSTVLPMSVRHDTAGASINELTSLRKELAAVSKLVKAHQATIDQLTKTRKK